MLMACNSLAKDWKSSVLLSLTQRILWKFLEILLGASTLIQVPVPEISLAHDVKLYIPDYVYSLLIQTLDALEHER